MTKVGDVIAGLRNEAGLTQEELAKRLDKPQSFVSKLESGERSLHVDELDSVATALDVPPTWIVTRSLGTRNILDDWDMSEEDMTDLIAENPSLRGMVLGYAAELMFKKLYLHGRKDIASKKDDDHDRTRQGDRRLRYKGRELLVEVKSLQTNSVKPHKKNPDVLTAGVQVDASDRRTVEFEDGSTLETTCLIVGQFDILAVNCRPFTDDWDFAFALNRDLARSTYNKYTEVQRNSLIKSMQYLTWPLEDGGIFTTDFQEILDRAWAAKKTPEAVEEEGEDG